MIKYYKEAGLYELHLKSLLAQKLPPPNGKCLTLKEAFFSEFDVNSHVYQIKYIGNLYLNMLLEDVHVRDPKIK